jgi:lambda family phage portal protein
MGILDIFKKPAPKPRGIQRRNYAAAARGRLFADFVGSNRSADSEIRWALDELRNRSRDLERNNEYFRRYLQLLRTNVVGNNGFRLQVKAVNTDGSPDIVGSQIIENAWREFARLGGPTVDGKMSLIDLENHVISAMARDGEVFLRIVRNRTFRHNIAVQIIEPDRVDEEMNERYINGNDVRMGVELDEYRRPVAYHILMNHPGDYDYTTLAKGTKRVRVPAAEIMHIYRQERAGQTRGVPWSTAAITALKMLHGYREAELVAARTAASKMGFFTSPAGDDFMADGYEGENGTGAPIYDAEAGTFHQLPAGVDFVPFDPSHPTSAFADFEKSILRGIAGGLGVSYTSLANDLEGTSYSSIRQGALEERDFYRTLHTFMIDHFLDPLYRVWLDTVVDQALTPITGMGKYEKFSANFSFRPRGFQWVDPLKEINAAVVGLNNGILSHSDIAANYGRDADETFAQIQRDKESAAQYGLDMAYEPFGEKQPVPAQIDGGDDAANI